MQILGKKLTLDEFRRYVAEYNFGSLPPSSLVIHHTWKPTKKDWQGEKSIAGLKSYYEGLKWSAGPHLFVAEDGNWLFTPMKDVGIHAGEGNATWTLLGKEYKGFQGPRGSVLKSYSIGIEVVGDYDAEKWSGQTKEHALAAVKILCARLNVPTERVFFHRDFPSAGKSCPGHAITKEWLGAELAKRDNTGAVKPNLDHPPSAWAQEAWEWQQRLGLDLSVLPQQPVTAEWVFAVMYKAIKSSKPI
jgi:N-acetylmuramoyl-L-alanine amidase CwlA